LSVANFQPRKNIPGMLRALGALPEISRGDLAVVLVGEGAPEPTAQVQEAASTLGPKARVIRAGYREGVELRALYAGATALVFASTCESFGIPAVEAMAQRCPVALANTTALPEVGGEAAWYFDPADPDSIRHAVRSLLDAPSERARRATLGRARAAAYRWARSAETLVAALRA
jgi:alpha-1,3-rhamnosyl/mannosyltransferase